MWSGPFKFEYGQKPVHSSKVLTTTWQFGLGMHNFRALERTGDSKSPKLHKILRRINVGGPGKPIGSTRSPRLSSVPKQVSRKSNVRHPLMDVKKLFYRPRSSKASSLTSVPKSEKKVASAASNKLRVRSQLPVSWSDVSSVDISAKKLKNLDSFVRRQVLALFVKEVGSETLVVPNHYKLPFQLYSKKNWQLYVFRNFKRLGKLALLTYLSNEFAPKLERGWRTDSINHDCARRRRHATQNDSITCTICPWKKVDWECRLPRCSKMERIGTKCVRVYTVTPLEEGLCRGCGEVRENRWCGKTWFFKVP
jgi:hypothetical protein